LKSKQKISVQLLSGAVAHSHYRLVAPFGELHAHGEVELVASTALADIVVAHQPSTDSYIQALEVAKARGSRIVVDYSTPDFDSRALALADVVWVSTPGLKVAVQAEAMAMACGLKSDDIVVVRDGWDWVNDKCVRDPAVRRRFFWRGSGVADEKNLWELSDELTDSILMAGATGHKSAGDRGTRGTANHIYDVVTMGSPFWMSVDEWRAEEIGVEEHELSSHHENLKVMHGSGACYGLVPLVDNDENNMRSPVDVMEMIACGMLPVVAARREYHGIPGVLSGDNYGLMLAMAMDYGDVARRACWEIALQWMEASCRLEDRNVERMESLFGLVE